MKFRPGDEKLQALWRRVEAELGPDVLETKQLLSVNPSRPFIETSTGTFLEDDTGNLIVLGRTGPDRWGVVVGGQIRWSALRPPASPASAAAQQAQAAAQQERLLSGLKRLRDEGHEDEADAVINALQGTPAPPERWVRRPELARIMGVGERTVARWVAEGMPSEMWGQRSRVFRVSECVEWARRRGQV